MASLNAKTTIKNFLKKGFIKDESHHHYYEFWYNGKLVARTYSSHNNEPITDGLISSMRKQCNMDKDFFVAFARCEKTETDYVKILKGKGYIDK